MAQALASVGVTLVENGLIPDALTRIAIRVKLRNLLQRLTSEYVGVDSPTDVFLQEIRSHPVAVMTEDANRQHYEVPTAYFDFALGKRKKYSSCTWKGAATLDEAEEEMLALTVERAEITDGMRILDLGCGWGSVSLYLAEKFPHAHITAFSNSRTQREYIERVAAEKGFTNVRVITGNAAEVLPEGPFDRVVSVEMLEHVRNHTALFARLKKEMAPGGKIFIHVFSHRTYPFLYEDSGSPDDWMAREFFSGGMMPSADLLPKAMAGICTLERQWYVNGVEYARTLRAWLARHDAHVKEIEAIFQSAGFPNPKVAANRWRLFYIACEEFFGFNGGREWGVSHYLFSSDSPPA